MGSTPTARTKRKNMSQKIVINKRFGGFGLSDEAIRLYAKKKGIKIYPVTNENDSLVLYFLSPAKTKEDQKNAEILKDWNIKRDDPALVEVVKELGKKANGTFCDLKIVEIPNNVKWEISEYDGKETIEEVHRKWD